MRKLNLWSAALVLAGISAAAHALPGGGIAFEQSGMPGKSIEGFTTPAASSKVQRATEMAQLHRWLTSEAVSTKRAPLSITLSQQERFSIGEIANCADCADVESSERRKLVGIARQVDVAVDLSSYGAKKLQGVARSSDGGLVWTLPVQSKGAMALRVGFSGLDLPIGAELYVYNQAGEAYGPYTLKGIRNGDLVSHAVTGDTAYVQLHMLGAPSAADLAKLRFNIAHIGHIGPEFEIARQMYTAMTNPKQGECSYNATCVINGECANNWPFMDNVRAATAHMLFASGGGYYICSGGLLNNSRNDSTPLFLTANHCISQQGEADSLEAFFDFRNSSCTDTSECTSSYTDLRTKFPTTLGATILATGSSGDYNLMQLSTTPAGTRHYMGWSSAAVANTNGVNLFRISHPSGAPQSWSTHDVNADGFSCRRLNRGTYIYSNDTAGATEGGSSGSPVLNDQGLVVGQLYGACGSNLNDTCDSVNNLTVDGAMAAYFANVEPFLDPTGSGGGGTDPGGDLTATVQSLTVTTESKGPWTFFTATAVVVDQNGNPIGNATVSGNWSGAVSGPAFGTTDGSGTASISGDKTRNGGTAEFCVSGVAGSGVTFDGNTKCANN